MSTRTKIVLIATLFNLLFEFAFRGVKGILIHPGFILGLFLIYFAYFTIIEELIRRYRLTNFQLLLAAFAFGLWPMTFLTGVVFSGGQGINWGALLGINIVWWGFLQGLLTFYLANRLVRRDWSEPPLGRGALTLAWIFLFLVHLGNFRRSAVLPRGEGGAYLVIIALFLGIAFFLWRRLKRQNPPAYEFERSRLLDLLAFGSVAVFLFAGFVVARNASFDPVSASVINAESARLAKFWSQAVFFGMLGYYALFRRRITI